MIGSTPFGRARQFALASALLAGIFLLASRPGQAGLFRDRDGDDGWGGLTRLGPCDFDRLYAATPVGRMPTGFLRGRLLVMTDFPFPKATVAVSGLGWKGKHIDCDGSFINQFTFKRRIASKARIDASWYDGKPAIAMDYPPGTPLFGNVRDEFREVCPGLYLGRIYARCPQPRFMGHMCLKCDPEGYPHKPCKR